MVIAHEVVFVDFDPDSGVGAGEAAAQPIAPDLPHALGAAAMPHAPHFASKDEKPASKVAKGQLDSEKAPDPHKLRQQTAARRHTTRTVQERRAGK